MVKYFLYISFGLLTFNLSFFNSVKQDIDISVYSLLGEKVYKEFIKDHFGNFETSFNLEIFGKSMYLLEIKTNNNIINEKITSIK